MYKQATVLQSDHPSVPASHRGTITAVPGERLTVMSGADHASHPVIDLRCGGNRRTDDPEWSMRLVNPQVAFLGATQIKISGFAATFGRDHFENEEPLLYTEVILGLG